MLRLQRDALARSLPGYATRWTSGQLDEFLKGITSDRFVADVLVGNLNVTASVIGSMHWSLIEFDEHLLAISDQPVTVVPLLAPGRTAPVTPLCEYAVRNTLGPDAARDAKCRLSTKAAQSRRAPPA